MTIEQRVEFLMQSIESHDRQIGENAQHIAELRASIDLLVRDRRIEDLETGRG